MPRCEHSFLCCLSSVWGLDFTQSRCSGMAGCVTGFRAQVIQTENFGNIAPGKSGHQRIASSDYWLLRFCRRRFPQT
jgi:hypothetical protein